MNIIYFICRTMLMYFIGSLFFYILYLIFHRFKKFRSARACLNYSYAAILNEERAKRLAEYCDIYCPDCNNCEKCKFWTCAGKENEFNG